MDIYIEREFSPITLNEWINYVITDSELTLSESGTMINPLTKTRMELKIPGRTLWRNYEITYKNGRIGSESSSKELITKLMEIAKSLSANVLDCGEKFK